MPATEVKDFSSQQLRSDLLAPTAIVMRELSITNCRARGLTIAQNN